MIEAAKKFLADSFQANPSYSFGDWHIMYDHSVNVSRFARQIGEMVGCDLTVLAIGGLLHDIGKVYQADEEILRREHARLGWIVSDKFLSGLGLSAEQLAKLKDMLSGEGDSEERQVIEDADIIAFFVDEQLQQALKTWADQKGLPNELQRKIDKFNQLRFPVSQTIAETFRDQMAERWGLQV
ncbi:MAG: HD domain-containing protein [bacterium]